MTPLEGRERDRDSYSCSHSG